MSRICIIGTSNIKHISLISLYTRFFDDNGIDYDIIYVDRYDIEERISAENIYRYRMDGKSSGAGKLIGFLKFKKYAERIIKENDYDLLITWQSSCAYLFSSLLNGKYKNRHIVNIRDYIAENNYFIKSMLKKLVSTSAFTTISSKGFLEFLPNGEYVTVNSINPDINPVNLKRNNIREAPYKIGFVGNCRYFREAYKLIDALANDERFELHYCGTNSEKAKEYADEKGIKNVYAEESFDPAMTTEIMLRFDMINSAFGSDAMDNRTLMPIRLYTAAMLGLPVLANADTQLGRVIGDKKIGFVIEDYAGLGDKLANYFASLDDNILSENCERFISDSQNENSVFYDRLREVIPG